MRVRIPKGWRTSASVQAICAATASAPNQLSTEIPDMALKRGKQATGQISQNLDATIRAYLKTEDLNTQEAKQLEEILNG